MDSSKKLLARRLLAEALFKARIPELLSTKNEWRVLMYHRVLEPETLPYPLQPGMYVRPHTFRMQLDYLASQCTVLPLHELLLAVQEQRSLPKNAVAITFDDGWVDNYQHAFPELKKRNLPATIFLATAFIDSADWFWTDTLPFTLQALKREERHRASVVARLEQSLPDWSQPEIFRYLDTEEHAERREILENLILRLKRVRREELRSLVKSLEQVTKEFCQTPKPTQFLTWKQVKEMELAKITFASHTHNHVPLTDLSKELVQDELTNSYQLFRANGVTPLSVFCYPEGRWNKAAQDILKEQQIEFSLSTERWTRLIESPPLVGRIGIHQDIASTEAMFACRLWVDRIF